MPTTSEYMQLATRVYIASDRNKIGIPENWSEINWEPDRFSVFSAGIYKNEQTNEFIISYKGSQCIQ